MKNQISPMQIKYGVDWTKYRLDVDDSITENMVLQTQKMLDEKFIELLKATEAGVSCQTILDITKLIPNAQERVSFKYELAIRIINVSDITQISHDIRRCVSNCVHLEYNRHSNYLDVYFEKSQDYVLVKMFTQ